MSLSVGAPMRYSSSSLALPPWCQRLSSSSSLSDSCKSCLTDSTVSRISVNSTEGSASRFGCPSKTSLKKSPPLWAESWVCQIKRLTSRMAIGWGRY